MLWPFNHFRKPRLAPSGTIEAIYGMIVTQAREPLISRDLGVPDTVNGRFDLVLLHLWLVLGRLKSAASGRALSQALFEHGINVQPILFPAVPDSSARLRFFLSSEHTEAQIRATIDAVATAMAGARPAEIAG